MENFFVSRGNIIRALTGTKKPWFLLEKPIPFWTYAMCIEAKGIFIPDRRLWGKDGHIWEKQVYLKNNDFEIEESFILWKNFGSKQHFLNESKSPGRLLSSMR
jgi:hypothetical protein